MELKIFESPQFGQIRTSGTSEQPLFCLADVCKVLALNPQDVKKRLNQKGVDSINTPTKGGNQNMLFINEQNLYKVIMRSDKPQAEAFQDWVCGEVLPSIRKQGGYISTTEEDTEETILARAVLLAQATIEKKNKQIEQMKEDIYVLEEEIETNAPKVLFADAVSTSQRSCLISELAKILTQNGYEIEQNRLFKKLREDGYLCKQGSYYNQPTQRAMEMGLFEIKQTSITKPDGAIIVNVTPKVTGKGQIYFINKFLNIKTA